MNPPNISTLLSYIDKTTSSEENQRIEQYLERYPEYNRILASLMMLKKQKKSNEEIVNFLKVKKENFIKKNFKKED